MTKIVSFLTFFLLLILVFISYFHPITSFTQDLGRHLLLGKLILQTLSVPNTNLLSYTYPDFPFVNHHYLSQVVFYVVENTLGVQTLLLLTSLMMVLSVGLLLYYAVKKTGFLSPLLISLFLLPVIFERIDLRPEIFSFFIMSFFIFLLFNNREKPTPLLYLLVPLTWLWIQLHIYFFVGIILLVLFFLDSVLTSRPHIVNARTKNLAVVLVASCLSILLNPNGLTGAIFPLQVFENYGYTIEENQNIFFLESLGFNKESAIPFKLSLVFSFILLLIQFKKARVIDWFLIGTFGVLAIMAVRNFPLFALATIIPLSYLLSQTLEKISSHKKMRSILHSPLPYVILITCIALQINMRFSSHGFGNEIPKGASSAVTYLLTQNIKEPIFNNFDIGSYLAYRLYPEKLVFVDGRPEAYPDTFFTNTYIPMQQDPKRFEEISGEYGFNTIIFSHTDQTPWAKLFLKSISQNPQWQTTYLDESVIILEKNNEKKIVTKPQITSKNPLELYSLATFYATIEDKSNEKKIYEQILTIDPKFCPALHNIALLSSKTDLFSNVYTARFQKYCQ